MFLRCGFSDVTKQTYVVKCNGNISFMFHVATGSSDPLTSSENGVMVVKCKIYPP